MYDDLCMKKLFIIINKSVQYDKQPFIGLFKLTDRYEKSDRNRLSDIFTLHTKYRLPIVVPFIIQQEVYSLIFVYFFSYRKIIKMFTSRNIFFSTCISNNTP